MRLYHLGLLDHVAHEAGVVDEGVGLDGCEHDHGRGAAQDHAVHRRRHPFGQAALLGFAAVQQAKCVDGVGHDERAVDRQQGDLGGDAQADDRAGDDGVPRPALLRHAGRR